MSCPQVGAGSVYAYTVRDRNGDILDGGRTYRLQVDPDPPAKNFWPATSMTPRPAALPGRDGAADRPE